MLMFSNNIEIGERGSNIMSDYFLLMIEVRLSLVHVVIICDILVSFIFHDHQIVTFGMNEQVGPISFPVRNRGELSKKPYSDKMARLIDEVGVACLVTFIVVMQN